MRENLATLVDDFRQHAAETAVVTHLGVRRYRTTYGELAELAGRFAAELERRGVGPGERVVIWGADSAEWIAVFFGCLLRGVLAVPLDRAGSAEFAARVVEDVRARLVVGDRSQLSVLGSQLGMPQGLKPPSVVGAGRPKPEGLGYLEAKDSAKATSYVEAGNEGLGCVTAKDVPRMELRGIGAVLPAEPLYAVSEAVTEDAAFQIVFTSGTTSEPKGIVHTHRNVLVTLRPIETEIGKYRRVERVFHPLRFLHSLPLSHVFGQFMGLWCPALLGAEVHFAEQLEPSRMVELIRRERISVLVAVPRVLGMIRAHLSSQFSVVSSQLKDKDGGAVKRPGAEAPGDEGTRSRGLKPAANPKDAVSAQVEGAHQQLRTENSQLTTVLKKWWRYRRVHRALGWKFWAVISGGATLPAELEAFWNEIGVALIQGYGMTETAALVTLNHPFHIAPGTIGKTLPGREVRIGDDGEVFVRGAMLAPAVWDHGAMHQREGEWLATGDLAEREAGGELKFLGRKGDVIVTSSGLNIHPADLEQALLAQKGVRGCVVVPCTFPAGPEAVAAVLFAGTDAELDQAVEAANRGLAEFQQVRHAVRWPELEFPYTSTGKVVRRKVAERVCARFGESSQLSVVSSQERQGDALLKVVAEVTGDEPRSQNRDLGHPDALRLAEDLKLDSLGRVQLLSAVEQRFGVELDEDAVAAAGTVGELRGLVERELGGGNPTHRDETAMNGAPGGRDAEDVPQGLKPLSVAEAGRPKPEGLGYLEAGRLREFVTHADHDSNNGSGFVTEEHRYPRWPWWWWVRAVRVVWIEVVMRPLVWLLAKPAVTFEDKSFLDPRALDLEPLLIISNHVTAFDGALVLYALPGRLRRRVAAAMSGGMLLDFRRARGQGNWALDLLAPGAYWLLTALFNVFPLPNGRGFRRSFRHAGEAMDEGYSVLIFPEGTRSYTGVLGPFRAGIGLLAKETEAPILPVALRGLGVAPGEKAKGWFHSGKIEVRVGRVVAAANDANSPQRRDSPGTPADAAELTAKLEQVERELVQIQA